MRRSNLLQLTGATALLLACGLAHADVCKLTIESDDQMHFSAHEMNVPAGCTDVEVTLKHSGQLPVKVMGHDWVLARDSDMSAIVNGGLAAGSKNGWLPDDKRVIASTHLVGGGESSTVTFSTKLLQEGARYVFFCTSPGHSSIMRGTFTFGTRVAQAGTK